jgi:hypothetical protein
MHFLTIGGKWKCDARTGSMCELVEIKVKKDKNLNEVAEFATILYGNETMFKNNISFAELKEKKRNF